MHKIAKYDLLSSQASRQSNSFPLHCMKMAALPNSDPLQKSSFSEPKEEAQKPASILADNGRQSSGFIEGPPADRNGSTSCPVCGRISPEPAQRSNSTQVTSSRTSCCFTPMAAFPEGSQRPSDELVALVDGVQIDRASLHVSGTSSPSHTRPVAMHVPPDAAKPHACGCEQQASSDSLQPANILNQRSSPLSHRICPHNPLWTQTGQSSSQPSSHRNSPARVDPDHPSVDCVDMHGSSPSSILPAQTPASPPASITSSSSASQSELPLGRVGSPSAPPQAAVPTQSVHASGAHVVPHGRGPDARPNHRGDVDGAAGQTGSIRPSIQAGEAEGPLAHMGDIVGQPCIYASIFSTNRDRAVEVAVALGVPAQLVGALRRSPNELIDLPADAISNRGHVLLLPQVAAADGETPAGITALSAALCRLTTALFVLDYAALVDDRARLAALDPLVNILARALDPLPGSPADTPVRPNRMTLLVLGAPGDASARDLLSGLMALAADFVGRFQQTRVTFVSEESWEEQNRGLVVSRLLQQLRCDAQVSGGDGYAHTPDHLWEMFAHHSTRPIPAPVARASAFTRLKGARRCECGRSMPCLALDEVKEAFCLDELSAPPIAFIDSNSAATIHLPSAAINPPATAFADHAMVAMAIAAAQSPPADGAAAVALSPPAITGAAVAAVALSPPATTAAFAPSEDKPPFRFLFVQDCDLHTLGDGPPALYAAVGCCNHRFFVFWSVLLENAVLPCPLCFKLVRLHDDEGTNS
eukprot:m.48182 g.48182  ORF g.48182 m.48182 type:complete len:759 (+) comp6020_c1_seq1:1487-3763(+)